MDGASEMFVSICGFLHAEAASDSPYLLAIVLIPLDELGRQIKPFTDRDLEGGDVIVIVDEVGRDAAFIEVEVQSFMRFHTCFQVVLGVVDACAHGCTVSFPDDFAKFDGCNKSGNDFLESLGRDTVVGGKGGEDCVRQHWCVFIENDGRGMVFLGQNDGRVGTGRGNGIVEAVVGHGGTKVLDKVLEVVLEPGIWGKDEGWSGLEEAFQDEMTLVQVFGGFLSSNGCHLWYVLIKSSACTFSDGSHILSL